MIECNDLKLSANGLKRLAIAFSLPTVMLYPFKRLLFSKKIAIYAGSVFGAVNAISYYISIERKIQKVPDNMYSTTMTSLFNRDTYHRLGIMTPVYVVVCAMPITSICRVLPSILVGLSNPTDRPKVKEYVRSPSIKDHVLILSKLHLPLLPIISFVGFLVAAVTYGPVKKAFLSMEK
jgi:hypothetical protein